MKFTKQLKNLLCTNWDSKTLLQIAEDLRKIGTYILGIAILAVVVQNDAKAVSTSIYSIILGFTFWFAGILLSKCCNNSTSTKD